tara:strand:- start:1847 stop:2383 length:537 start_codon:yes stop_codon:yes gene_type:complete
MGWKNWPAWLRIILGGIVAVGVYFVYHLIRFRGDFVAIVFDPYDFDVLPIILIIFFIIGSIIGWAFGKSWKDLPYWLKGTTVAGGISIILLILALICDSFFSEGYVCIPFILPFLLSEFLQMIPGLNVTFFRLFEELSFSFFLWKGLVGGFLVNLVLGAIIGWVYGKIKGRKQVGVKK